MPSPCPTAVELKALLDGTLPRSDRARIDRHLEECGPCRQQINELAGGNESWLKAKPVLSADPLDSPPLREKMKQLKRGQCAMACDSPEKQAHQVTRLRYLGDYEILEELGRGGMGVVYRARQMSLQREVAVKVILAGQLASAADVRRFHVEAEAAAKLNHPNIVPIYEIGEHEGHHFFSMKLLEGGSLANRHAGSADSSGLVGRTPPYHHVARLAATIARAVHYAHQRGVLHRDLKPGNILLDRESHPHVTDFGLAKLIEHDSNLTHSMAVMGSPNYMAPELAAGHSREATTAVDVYSLGAIVYKLLAGSPPFQAASTAKTIHLVIEAVPVSPAAHNPSVPSDLATICLKCLEKEPARRYASAELLAEDLERFCRDEPILARPVGWAERSWRWSKRQPALASSLAALVLVFVLGFCGVLWKWRGEVSQRQLAQEGMARLHCAITQVETERAEALLQAGDSSRGLAYLARLLRQQPTNRVAAERLMSALTMRSFCLPVAPLRHGASLNSLTGERKKALANRFPFRSPGSLVMVNFSPDGRQVVTASKDGTARLWNAFTGEPVGEPMRHEAEVVSAQFSHDGQKIVTTSVDGTAKIWAADTGRLLGPPLRHDDVVHWAEFNQDDGLILTASRDNTVRIWNAQTGESTRQFTHSKPVYFASFSPDSRLILTACEDNSAHVWEAETGAKVTTTRHVFYYQLFPATFPQFNPVMEQMVTFWGNSGGIAFQWTNAPRTSLQHDNFVTGAAYSPNGMFVATVSADAFARIWKVTALTGSPAVPPLRHEAEVYAADFSRDAQRLVTGSRDKSARLWEVSTGDLLAEPLRHQDAVLSARISPDGQRLATATESDTAWLWEVRVRQPLTDLHVIDRGAELVKFSPDGKQTLVVDDYDFIRLLDVASPTSGSSGGPNRSSTVINNPTPIELKLVSLTNLWRFSDSGDLGATWREAVFDDGAWASGNSPFGSGSAALRGLPAGMHIDPRTKITPLAPGKSTYYFRTRFNGSSKLAGFGLEASAQTIGGDYGVVLYVNGTEAVRIGMPSGTINETNSEGSFDLPAGVLLEGENVLAAEVHPVSAASSNIVFAMTLDAALSLTNPLPDALLQNTSSAGDEPHVEKQALDLCEAIPRVHYHNVISDVRFSPDGRYFVAADDFGFIVVWATTNGQPVGPLLRLAKRVTQVRFSPDGKRLATSSEDGVARIWNIGSSEPQFEFRHDGAVNSIEFSPDGNLLVTTSSDGTAQLWDANTGRSVGGPLKHDAEVLWAVFDPAGRRVATASRDKTVRIWSVQTGLMLTAPLVHADSLHTHGSVTFSPDGSRLATVAGNAAQIWDPSTGRAVTPLLRHRQLVRTAQFSPDGNKLLTASEDGTARLWDTETGYPVSEPLRHGSLVTSAELSPDGSKIVTTSPDRHVRLWEVTSAPLPTPAWLPELAEALVGQRIDEQEISRAIPVERLYQLRRQLSASTNQTYYDRWAHWFFADGAARTISPSSEVTVPEYVQRRIAENTIQSLEAATTLEPTNALAFARRAQALEWLSHHQASAFRGPVDAQANADWFSRYATNLAPTDPEIRLIRESIAQRIPPATALPGASKKWRSD